MYAEITTALAGLKTVSDLASLVLRIKVDAAVTEKAIESQAAIITLQSAVLNVQLQNQELLEENKRLKQEIIDANNWEAESDKYTLTEVGGRNGIVYALKPEYETTAPRHYLCPSCYEEKHKSILQSNRLVMNRTAYSCSRCPMVVQM